MADISRGTEPQLHSPQRDQEARPDELRPSSLSASSSNVTLLPTGQHKAGVRPGKAPPPPVKPPLAIPPSALHSDPGMRVGRAEPATDAPPRPISTPRGRTHASRRPLWQSPLTRRILAVNILAIAIPVVGLLYLDNYRQSLIQSELELLKTEAKLFSGALAASGVVTGPLGDERLLPETTRQTVRRLVDVSQTRARLFAPDSVMIADSFLLSGPGGVVEMQPLPPLDSDDSLLWRTIVGAYDWVF
jgi:two-component system, OmpR family, sensor histidine kinase ChvG